MNAALEDMLCEIAMKASALILVVAVPLSWGYAVGFTREGLVLGIASMRLFV